MDPYQIATSPMAHVRPLKSPPITEALVDIKTQLRERFDPREFLSAAPRLAPDYPRVEERREYKTKFQIGPSPEVAPTSEDLGTAGAIFFSVDSKQIVQFRRDGFTVNRLAPYSGWASLRQESLARWNDYKAIAPIESVLRVALRTINRIAIKAPIEDMSIHVTQPMSSPPGAPPAVIGFLQRIVSKDVDTATTVIVSHSLEPDVNPEQIALILDIDVFVDRSDYIERDGIEPTLERLHTLRNDVFFGSITEETARRFA